MVWGRQRIAVVPGTGVGQLVILAACPASHTIAAETRRAIFHLLGGLRPPHYIRRIVGGAKGEFVQESQLAVRPSVDRDGSEVAH